jgi:transposase
MIFRMDKRFLEECLANGMSLEAIGERAGKHPSTVGYWVKKHGLRAVGTDRFSPRGGLDRSELEFAVENGLTLEEMATSLSRSISTVRYWLERYGFRATGGTRQRESREAKRRGLRHIERSCPRHGRTKFVLDGRGSYRCMKCRRGDVSSWRRRAKQRLVEEAGGMCQICGYDRYPGALQFHHLDPSTKSFSLSRQGCTRAFAELKAEAAKCALLCANCHAEVEAGVVEVDPSP